MMLHIAKDAGGMVVAVFANPQPDALDDDGNLVCKGVETVEVADDAPEVLEFLQRTAGMGGERG